MLSVIVITKNEEANIRRCLKSVVQWAHEIIVLDSGSTDKTLEIAREFTSHVYIDTDWQGYGVQKQRALSYASGHWVLNLDADEAVSEDLKNAIQKAMQANVADAYRLPIKMNFYNQPLKHSFSPKRHVRLFKRAGARFSKDIVHEKIILPPDFRILQMKEPIYHQSFQDISHALYKINRYSSCSAKISLEKSSPPMLTKIIFSSGWMFFRCFILQKGFLDGKAGFIMAVLQAQGTFFRGIKQKYPDKSQYSVFM